MTTKAKTTKVHDYKIRRTAFGYEVVDDNDFGATVAGPFIGHDALSDARCALGALEGHDLATELLQDFNRAPLDGKGGGR